MKLTVSLTPRACWGQNMRSILPKDAWDKVRRYAYARAGYQCEICGMKGQVFAHEDYTYDHQRRLQILVGIKCICKACHTIKNWGITSRRLSTEQQHKAMSHFVDVNGHNAHFGIHMRKAEADHRRYGRSGKYKIIIGLEEYHKLLNFEGEEVSNEEDKTLNLKDVFGDMTQDLPF